LDQGRVLGIGHSGAIGIQDELARHAIGANMVNRLAQANGAAFNHPLSRDQGLFAMGHFADANITIAAEKEKVEIPGVLVTANYPKVVVIWACDFRRVDFDPDIAKPLARVRPQHSMRLSHKNAVTAPLVVGDI
jgi:hypothetical protein